MRLPRLLTAVVFLAVVFLTASSVSAQVLTSTGAVLPEKPSGNARTGALPIQSDTYGTSALTWVSLTAWDFHPIDSTTTYGYAYLPRFGIHRTGGNHWFDAPLHLPEGAVVSALELTACNTNALDGPGVYFQAPLKAGGFASTPGQVGVAAMAGCQIVAATAFSWTVNNDTTSYMVEANFYEATDNTVLLASVRVGYKLQISPDPATATFADVPHGHPFHRFVEALVAAGITGGCGGGNYCPDAPVTRGQMAVFLSAALGLHWAP
jgi:hypothetical protein